MLKLFFHLFTFCCTLYMCVARLLGLDLTRTSRLRLVPTPFRPRRLVWTIIQDMIKQEDQPKARSVIMEAIASLH